MLNLPRSLSEAKQSGSLHYYTGKECKHGHLSKRTVHAGKCLECVRTSDRSQSSLEKRRKRYKQNPDRIRKSIRKYASKNRDLLRKRHKEWRDKNPHKYLEYRRNREANIRGALGSHSQKDVTIILESQDYECPMCFQNISEEYHVDHFIPVSEGGGGVVIINQTYNFYVLHVT